MPEPMSLGRRVGYALGGAGFQLTDRIVVVLAVYFYLPPPGRGLVPQVPPEIFLGGMTVFGAAMVLGRIVDSFADPFVGHASDRSRSRLGRRRVFLAYGLVPMVVLPALLFYPPGEPGSTANALWLTGLLALYFIAFTVYVGPYLALIPEMASADTDRAGLATLMAVISFPIWGVFATAWPVGLDLGRASGLDASTSMRWIVIGASVLAALLCLAPIAAVDERRFARSVPSDMSLRQALVATLANRAFAIYLAAQILFIFGVTIVQPLLPYLTTVLLGRTEGYALYLGISMFAGLGAGFAGLRPLVARLGTKRAMIVCVTLFALGMAALGLLAPDVPGGPRDARNLLVAYGGIFALGIPIAGFLVLPHVLISQLVDEDEARTGANRAAMFFGMQGFLTKWMYGVSLWAFTFLLARFGNSPGEPLGVILVGPVGAVTCAVSALLYSLYPEREVLAGGRRDVA